jgi:DNA-binding transcriptional ArsR family regulator
MNAFTTPYQAIADGTRRQILDLLQREPMTAGIIAQRFRKISRPAVSKHLAILRRARLVHFQKQGRERVYALNAEPLREVNAWVRQYEKFWDQQLQSFKDYVEAEAKKEAPDEQES